MTDVLFCSPRPSLGLQRLVEMDTVGAGLFERALGGWTNTDRRVLAPLMQRLVDDLADVPQAGRVHSRQEG
jgi:hypothetical protein